MFTLVPTLRVRADVGSHCRTAGVPPVRTLTVKATAAVSIVTVDPFTMVTLSLTVGTTPPTHVAGALQLPPAAVEEMLPAGLVVTLFCAGPPSAPSLTA